MSFWYLQISARLINNWRLSLAEFKDSLRTEDCATVFLKWKDFRVEILTIILWVFLGDLKMPKGHFEINNRKKFLLMQMNRIFEAPLNRVEKSRVEVSNIPRHTYLKPLLVRPVSSSWPCSVYHKRPCSRKSLPLTHSQPESHRLYKWEGITYKKRRLNIIRI